MLRGSRVLQIGILVRDVSKAAHMWAVFLQRPVPEVRETLGYSFTQATYQGEPCNGRIRQAAISLDNIQLEFIEPIDDGNPSIWLDCLNQQGEGLHHIAFQVTDMDQQVQNCASQNMGCIQRGNFSGGCYAYIDARERLGIILEYLEHFNKN